MKTIEQGVQGRTKLATGAKKLADAVASTLGPFGQSWFLDKKNSITDDGVTVARTYELEDEVENRGATAIREAAIKTVEEVGDGTTTAIVLSWEIYDVAAKYLAQEGVIGKKTHSEIQQQIEQERKEITEKLVALAEPIITREQLVASATVAVEDPVLGILIGEAQWDLGKEGYLLVEETAERSSSVERVSGIRIDNGAGTSNVFNNLEKQTLEVKDMKFILTSETIRDLKGLEPILTQLSKNGIKEVVVMARAWTEDAIKLCELNSKNGLYLYPLNAPYTDMKEVMKDIAAVTGATFYDSESTKLENLQLSDIGFVSKVVARRMDAEITGRIDSKENITKRVEELKAQRTGSQSEFEKKLLTQRIAQLENGFALIKVGSASDMERRRLYDKAEDAVHAVRAAFQEGTVKGAGLAFKEIGESLPDSYLLKQPIMAINKRIMNSAPQGFVIEDWVRDPVKVLRIALERACVAASAFAGAGGVITEKKPETFNQLLEKLNK